MHDRSPPANTGGSPEAAPSWRRELAAAIRDPADLVRELGLPASLARSAGTAQDLFPLVVTRSFLARMRHGDPHDPLLRQVLPIDAEAGEQPATSTDPVGDLDAERAPGLLQKYAGRVLVIAAPSCAIHCRYCFRRHFPYDAVPRGREVCDAAVAHVAADPSIREVILSGGDPLLLGDALLERWSERLAVIPHVTRLRVHTRLPIVLPSRVDAGLLAWLHKSAPSPRALGRRPRQPPGRDRRRLRGGPRAPGRRGHARPQPGRAAPRRERRPGRAGRLCERLADLGVQPYYLHQLDPVAGAAHFHVDEARGRELVAELRRRLPGYAVPRYVREVAGEPHKLDIG